MFKIGEFSTIARVSAVQLRHYDDIDLFKPNHIDTQSGYRYYTIEQLPQLNRILALKDLGLTLEQVANLIHDNISQAEIQGMLHLKQAQIEQSIDEEFKRIRRIQARLKQIRQQGTLSEHDVVLKDLPQQYYLSVQEQAFSLQKMGVLYYVVGDAIRKSPIRGFGYCMAVFHDRVFRSEDVNWELGFLTKTADIQPIPLSDGRELTLKTLPPVPSIASVVHQGAWSEMHLGYGAIGAWIEVNNYQIAGQAREVYHNLVPPEQDDDFVVEIQFPVRKAEEQYHD